MTISVSSRQSLNRKKKKPRRGGRNAEGPAAARTAQADPRQKHFEEPVPPQEAILKANQAARMEPTRAGYINAIQVYPWTEGALYRL